MSDTEARAQRIRRFLRQLFERTYAFSLEAFTKKSLKDAIKALHDYEAFSSDYVVATVIQQALGGHAIPVDEPARRVLGRLGIADSDADNQALRGVLERAVPKNRGIEFIDLIEELAHDTCVEGEPDCARCDLRKICPTGMARQEQAVSAAKSSRQKAPKTAPAKTKEPAAPTKTVKGKSTGKK
jgi:endonuclease-3